MFKEYSNNQNIAYKILKNQVLKNKLSHAYIIENNNINEAMKFSKEFVKFLLCEYQQKETIDKCSCNICTSIDDNNYIELKIIEPEGLWIKKEQIEIIKDLVLKKSIIGNKKVYIINNAEMMKPSISNSLLKFIEEPEDGIIGILITNNINKILPTILSRCQIIKLKNKKIKETNILEKIYLSTNNTLTREDFFENINQEDILRVIKFIEYYEENKINTLCYTKKMWKDNFNDRKKNIIAFFVILMYYKDVLNLYFDREIEVFNNYVDSLKKTLSKNKIETVINKIEKISNNLNKIQYNVNLDLIVDKLIIDLEKSVING